MSLTIGKIYLLQANNCIQMLIFSMSYLTIVNDVAENRNF